MSGLYGNYFSKYKFPRVGISRRDLLYRSMITAMATNKGWNNQNILSDNQMFKTASPTGKYLFSATHIFALHCNPSISDISAP